MNPNLLEAMNAQTAFFTRKELDWSAHYLTGVREAFDQIDPDTVTDYGISGDALALATRSVS